MACHNVTFILLLMLIMNGQVKALRADMKRVHSLSSQERLRGAVQRSAARLKTIETSVKGEATGAAGAPVNRGDKVGEFMMTMSIGTPPRKMVGIVDTGSDLIWTQCKPCVNCYTQPDPVFDPSKSTTYNKLPCSASLCSSLPSQSCNPHCRYFYQYGDGSNTTGVLSNETFTMWDGSGKPQSIPGVAFGCSHDTQGDGFSESDGLVGLGRGDLSLISQIGSTIGSKFSYCLTTYMDDSVSETSPLFFGSAVSLDKSKAMSTPMLENHARTDLNTFYYISVNGISVGESLADIPQGTFDIREDGSGGFIIDSGTTVTYLAPAAFSAVAKALNSELRDWTEADGSDYGFDLCYQIPSGGVSERSLPNITFHFGKGADYVVEGKYNFGLVDDERRLLCLLMVEINEDSVANVPSIFGNYQQQNYHILYDNDVQRLSFAPATCHNLSEPNFDQSFMASGSPSPAPATAFHSGTTPLLKMFSLLLCFLFQFY